MRGHTGEALPPVRATRRFRWPPVALLSPREEDRLRFLGSSVLVADGTPGVHALAMRVLSSRGWSVASVGDGRDLVDRLLVAPGGVDAPPPYAALLLDARLPGLSGLDALEFLRLGPCRWTPVVMMVDPGDADGVWNALRLGAVSVLDKPVDEARLRRAFEIVTSRVS